MNTHNMVFQGSFWWKTVNTKYTFKRLFSLMNTRNMKINFFHWNFVDKFCIEIVSFCHELMQHAFSKHLFPHKGSHNFHIKIGFLPSCKNATCLFKLRMLELLWSQNSHLYGFFILCTDAIYSFNKYIRELLSHKIHIWMVSFLRELH